MAKTTMGYWAFLGMPARRKLRMLIEDWLGSTIPMPVQETKKRKRNLKRFPRPTRYWGTKKSELNTIKELVSSEKECRGKNSPGLDSVALKISISLATSLTYSPVVPEVAGPVQKEERISTTRSVFPLKMPCEALLPA
jgi:hypothetical protein